MNADDERAFEQQLHNIGEHLRPAPGPRFYQRLAGAPWKGEQGMASESKVRTRRWGWGAVEMAALVLVVALVAVLGRVKWLGGLVPGGGADAPTATPTLVGEGGLVVPGGTATPVPTAGTPGPGEVGVLTDVKIIVVDPSTTEIMGTYQSLDELRAGGDWQSAGRVLFYTLSFGESYASVAEAFGLQIASLAASNPTLAPNAGDMLFIPPLDGVVYHVQAGDTLAGIAYHYQVSPYAIAAYAPNGLNVAAYPEGGAEDGGLALNKSQLLVIPGGVLRATPDLTLPTITRAADGLVNNAPGACRGPFSGPVGAASFIWPVDNHYLALDGADFIAGVHPGLDLGAAAGTPVYAVDAGVVVFAGWDESGYGNLVIIDHGNGWQSAYAHLETVQVVCGQAVEAGNTIATVGNTGNITDAALHFELIEAGQGPVNPWLYLPQ